MKSFISSYQKLTMLILSIAIFSSCGKETSKVETIQAIKVATYQVNETPSSVLFEASGTIEADKNANISTRLMGEVAKVYVKIGDKVKKGDLLLSLNSADLKAKKGQVNAQISQANSAFINAKKDYERFTQLFKENSASQKELDNITSNYEQAKAGLEAAKQMQNEVAANLAYADIKAPFDGVITGKFINNGALANPGMPLLSMENTANYLVKSYVNESQIGKINTGEQVQVVVKSSNKHLTGIITELSISSKNSGGLYQVKIGLNSSENIYSGMFVSVAFSGNKKGATTILIPKSAIVYNGQLTGVYSVSLQNTAILRWLRLGKYYNDNIEVLSGLKADEKIITSAEGKLYNGANITLK